MPAMGRGRIVLWEGASLWILTGEHKTAEIRPHSHHAIQITFELEGRYEINVMGERLSGPVTALASDLNHSFRAGRSVAFLFIAPESSVGRSISRFWFNCQPWTNITCKQILFARDELRLCFNQGCSANKIRQLGKKIVSSLPGAEDTVLTDPRILAMINYAEQNLDDTVTLPAAANHINLSQSRARHLFAEQTGLPFKSYVLWLRLSRAVSLYAKGYSLTNAAHEAGFADSAHFSRTFRRTFGLPATALSILKD